MAVSYSVLSVTVPAGPGNAQFVVERTGLSDDLATATTAEFTTIDNTAIAGTDYTATAGTLYYANGATVATVLVEILSATSDNTTAKNFLFSVAGYGSGTCTILSNNETAANQVYLYLPEADAGYSTTIPTSASPTPDTPYRKTQKNPDTGKQETVVTPTTGYLTTQAVSGDFSDPKDATAQMPLAYMRFGKARADMNVYERLIVNGYYYHPKWAGKKNDPRGPGPLQWMATPRGLNTRYIDQSQVDAAMVDNDHLDGIQIYSNRNYTVTVAGQSNTVVQGDKAVYVRGSTRELLAGSTSRWTWFDQDSPNRTATGIDNMHGEVWGYTISNAHQLSILAAMKIEYSLGVSFKVLGAVETVASSTAKYQITNSIGITVKGLDISGSCDVLGNYNANLMGHSKSRASQYHNQSAWESITFSIDPLDKQKLYTWPVQVAAGAVAAAALAATAPTWKDAFTTNGKFYEDASIADLKSEYSGPFLKHMPEMVTSTAALAAAAVVGSAYAQKLAALSPSLMPKIEMTALGGIMTLSCGASSIKITNTGITIVAPTIIASAPTLMSLTGTQSLLLSSGTVTAISPNFVINGTLGVSEQLLVMADVSLGGTLNAPFINS